MLLEKALHERWNTDSQLCEWIPPERLFTGRVTHGQMPYATLWRLGSRPLWRTPAGDLLEEVQLALHIWHPEYETLRAILDRMREVLDRSSFDLEESGRVVALMTTEERYRQEPEGPWRADVELTAQVYWPPEN